MKKKIGLLGGTFNPIHIGHLLLAESARDQFQLDQILFIPTGNNPFKLSHDKMAKEHRLKMVELAIEKNDDFAILTHEIDQSGVTYTIDTISMVQKKYPNCDFYFIAGGDLMFEITMWKGAAELLSKVHFITTFRPGYSQEKLNARIEELRDRYHAMIHKLYMIEIDIASSGIRARVKNGDSIRYLIPESVEAYIYDHKLYIDHKTEEKENDD